MVVLAGGWLSLAVDSSLPLVGYQIFAQPQFLLACEPSICLCGFLVQANPSCFVSNKALSCQTL